MGLVLFKNVPVIDDPVIEAADAFFDADLGLPI